MAGVSSPLGPSSQAVLPAPLLLTGTGVTWDVQASLAIWISPGRPRQQRADVRALSPALLAGLQGLHWSWAASGNSAETSRHAWLPGSSLCILMAP